MIWNQLSILEFVALFVRFKAIVILTFNFNLNNIQCEIFIDKPADDVSESCLAVCRIHRWTRVAGYEVGGVVKQVNIHKIQSPAHMHKKCTLLLWSLAFILFNWNTDCFN